MPIIKDSDNVVKHSTFYIGKTGSSFKQVRFAVPSCYWDIADNVVVKVENRDGSITSYNLAQHNHIATWLPDKMMTQNAGFFPVGVWAISADGVRRACFYTGKAAVRESLGEVYT